MNKHPFPEDLFALLTASLLVSLGVYFLKVADLVSGGATGLALLLAQTTPVSFGVAFFAINLPFYYLAWREVGSRFCLNTLITVSVVSSCVDVMPLLFRVEYVNPLYATVAAGLCIGVGMLIVFRHSSSLGGFGILALYVQKRWQIPTGTTFIVIDLMVLLLSLLVVPLSLIAFSVLSAVLVSAVLTMNHKPNRYQSNYLQINSKKTDK